MRLQGRRSSYDFSRAHHVVVDGHFVEIVSNRRLRECSAGHVSWVVTEPETRRTRSEGYVSASVLRLSMVLDGDFGRARAGLVSSYGTGAMGPRGLSRALFTHIVEEATHES